MHWLYYLGDYVLHLDQHLNVLATQLGPWVYGLLFGSIFGETGLIVLPFLPGETLVFSAAALAATPESDLNVWAVAAISFAASFLGDITNYLLARRFGWRLFRRKRGWLFSEKQLAEARYFYSRYGGKTLILSRYIPLIRDVAPFMAGASRMDSGRVFRYILLGTAVWAFVFSWGGLLFAKIPAVRDHFGWLLVAVGLIAAVPVILGTRALRLKDSS